MLMLWYAITLEGINVMVIQLHCMWCHLVVKIEVVRYG